MIVFLLLNFKCSLYILDNSPLLDVSFANIFSQSVACLLILLTVSFTEQRCLTFFHFSFLCLIRLPALIYFIYSFGRTTWHVGSQFPDQGSKPRPLQWKHRFLTTGLPGKSPEMFNFNGSSAYQLFLSWIMPLVLYLKQHHFTQGHLGFLLCYLLRVLQFYILI